MKKLAVYITCLIAIYALQAQQTPANSQKTKIAIRGATAHLGNGNVIENSLVVFEAGLLKYVGTANKNMDFSKMEVIQAKDQHIYPGFIITNSTLGLIEIDAVRATDDESEIGIWNPHIRSLIAYNAESKVVETMRPNGVLIGQITPRGGVISGKSSVVQFDAWNWEDAVIKTDEGIHMNWPNIFGHNHSHGGESLLKINDRYTKEVSQIDTYFKNSKAYNALAKNEVHLPYKAMLNLFNGKTRLYIHVNEKKGIFDAVKLAKNHGVKKITIVGAYDAYKVTDFLKTNDISVLLQRVHLRPNKSDEDYDLPYRLAKVLVEADLTVALEASGDMERMNSRNLPFYAGTTVAYGLSKAQALQLITLNAAKILGIDKQYGSLEVGKSATLFISEGDALDMRTNQLSRAFIDGRDISLESHQTKLWKRYTKKYKSP